MIACGGGKGAQPIEVVNREALGGIAGALRRLTQLELNLVGGSKLAWQERLAESFTVSPLHCGSYHVGYRKTDGPLGARYGGTEGVSLGGCITTSGAAAHLCRFEWQTKVERHHAH